MKEKCYLESLDWLKLFPQSGEEHSGFAKLERLIENVTYCGDTTEIDEFDPLCLLPGDAFRVPVGAEFLRIAKKVQCDVPVVFVIQF